MDTIQTIVIAAATGLTGGYISHYFAQKAENYKFIISKRDKVTNIASLFSLWAKYRGHERKWLKGEDLIEYYQELTKMSFELTLWVDDEDLLREIMRRLKNEDKSKNTIELLLEARKLVNENEESKLQTGDITYWPLDTKFIEDGK